MNYQAPRITRYSERELIDWMGPVETNYCDLSSATADPATFLVGKSDIRLILNGAVVSCPAASTIQLSLINDTGLRLTNDTLPASSAAVSGFNLVIEFYDFGLIPDEGAYTIEVILIDSSGCASAPVFASFNVL